MMPTHCSVSTLLLVNAAHPFSAAPPDDLVPATANASVLLRREAAEQLQRALAHIDAGQSILPIDGFRSHEAQAQLYASSLKENGTDFTQKFVAPSGASEHETGLAIDLALHHRSIQSAPIFLKKGSARLSEKSHRVSGSSNATLPVKNRSPALRTSPGISAMSARHTPG